MVVLQYSSSSVVPVFNLSSTSQAKKVALGTSQTSLKIRNLFASPKVPICIFHLNYPLQKWQPSTLKLSLVITHLLQFITSSQSYYSKSKPSCHLSLCVFSHLHCLLPPLHGPAVQGWQPLRLKDQWNYQGWSQE